MYLVDTRGEAMEQIEALPAKALVPLAEALVVLRIIPWNGDSINESNPEAPVRTLPFGGLGLITYLVVEAERQVDVLRVQWLG